MSSSLPIQPDKNAREVGTWAQVYFAAPALTSSVQIEPVEHLAESRLAVFLYKAQVHLVLLCRHGTQSAAQGKTNGARWTLSVVGAMGFCTSHRNAVHQSAHSAIGCASRELLTGAE